MDYRPKESVEEAKTLKVKLFAVLVFLACTAPVSAQTLVNGARSRVVMITMRQDGTMEREFGEWTGKPMNLGGKSG